MGKPAIAALVYQRDMCSQAAVVIIGMKLLLILALSPQEMERFSDVAWLALKSNGHVPSMGNMAFSAVDFPLRTSTEITQRGRFSTETTNLWDTFPHQKSPKSSAQQHEEQIIIKISRKKGFSTKEPSNYHQIIINFSTNYSQILADFRPYALPTTHVTRPRQHLGRPA